MEHVIIYSDGSCLGNPGKGGWAALIRTGAREWILTGSEAKSTNNRMELTAALKALESLSASSEVDFYTDSQYLRRGITEWLPDWRARGWKRKTGKLINVELWQGLEMAIKKHNIHWYWVKGHSTSGENQRVDKLAREAMLGQR